MHLRRLARAPVPAAFVQSKEDELVPPSFKGRGGSILEGVDPLFINAREDMMQEILDSCQPTSPHGSESSSPSSDSNRRTAGLNQQRIKSRCREFQMEVP